MRRLAPWLAFGLSLAAVLAVAVAVQAYAELWNVRFDLTAQRRLSLREGTRALLAELRSPLRVTYYYARGKRQQAADLLDLFAEPCPRFRYELVDLDRHPARARDDGVDRPGRAVLDYRGRRLVAAAVGEAELAAGIERLLHGRAPVLYLTTGHGERTLALARGDQLGDAGALMRREGYRLRSLSLATDGAPPRDAAAVIVAGPRSDFAPAELEALDRYLERGGAVLVLADPGPLPGLEAWLARRGVVLSDDILIDGSNRAFGTDGTDVVIPYWRNRPPTDGIDGAAVLARARSVAASRSVPEEEVAVVARTARESFRATGSERARRGRVEFDPTRDEPGPIGVMAVASVGTEGRLAVIGDADFASDRYLRLLGNQSLLVHTIAWLARDPSATHAPQLQAIDAAPVSAAYVSQRQMRRILLLGTAAEPLLFLGLGVAVVLLRRRR